MATVNEKMTAIANKIRSYTGDTDPLTLDEMPDAIQLGWLEGRREAAEIAYNEGIVEGKKSQYDEFWDSFQHNGNRSSYYYGFSGIGWGKETFKPKYKITPIGSHSANSMFYLFGSNPQSVDDLFDYRNVKNIIDFSQTTTAQSVFEDAAIDYIDVDFSKATTLWGCFRYTWRRNYVTHIKLKVSELCTTYDVAFQGCDQLTDLNFVEGSVISRKISMSASPKLTYESLMSIINALKDYSGTTSTYTLTLHADAKARLSDAEKATITQKGWTLA